MRFRRRPAPIEPPDDNLRAQIEGNEVDGWKIRLYDGDEPVGGVFHSHATEYAWAKARASLLLGEERRRRNTAQRGEVRV